MIEKFTDINIEAEEGILLCYCIGLLMMEEKYNRKTPDEMVTLIQKDLQL